MLGRFVASNAGHDKGKAYVVIKETEEQLFLCDGLLKPLAKPKKKNKKHVQLLGNSMDESFIRRLKVGEPVTNEEIKHALKVVTAKSYHQEGVNLEEFYVEK
jgi:ribosomal protein L14E/L6E/L27E